MINVPDDHIDKLNKQFRDPIYYYLSVVQPPMDSSWSDIGKPEATDTEGLVALDSETYSSPRYGAVLNKLPIATCEAFYTTVTGDKMRVLSSTHDVKFDPVTTLVSRFSIDESSSYKYRFGSTPVSVHGATILLGSDMQDLYPAHITVSAETETASNTVIYERNISPDEGKHPQYRIPLDLRCEGVLSMTFTFSGVCSRRLGPGTVVGARLRIDDIIPGCWINYDNQNLESLTISEVVSPINLNLPQSDVTAVITNNNWNYDYLNPNSAIYSFHNGYPVYATWGLETDDLVKKSVYYITGFVGAYPLTTSTRINGATSNRNVLTLTSSDPLRFLDGRFSDSTGDAAVETASEKLRNIEQSYNWANPNSYDNVIHIDDSKARNMGMTSYANLSGATGGLTYAEAIQMVAAATQNMLGLSYQDDRYVARLFVPSKQAACTLSIDSMLASYEVSVQAIPVSIEVGYTKVSYVTEVNDDGSGLQRAKYDTVYTSVTAESVGLEGTGPAIEWYNAFITSAGDATAMAKWLYSAYYKYTKHVVLQTRGDLPVEPGDVVKVPLESDPSKTFNMQVIEKTTTVSAGGLRGILKGLVIE